MSAIVFEAYLLRLGRRLTLVCPRNHIVVQAEADSVTGRRLLTGDWAEEECANTNCDWTGRT